MPPIRSALDSQGPTHSDDTDKALSRQWPVVSVRWVDAEARGGPGWEDPEDMVESGASESDWGSDEDDTVSEGGSPSPRQPRQRSNSVMLDENPLEAAEAFPPTI